MEDKINLILFITSFEKNSNLDKKSTKKYRFILFIIEKINILKKTYANIIKM